MLRRCVSFSVLLNLAACSGGSPTSHEVAANDAGEAQPFSQTALASFSSPWAFAFLPDGKILVTEKAGSLILFDPVNSAKATIAGTPRVLSDGQGALMDIAPAPNFATSRAIYFSYSEPAASGASRVALAHATLDQAGLALKNSKVIFRASQDAETGGHYSGRIAFSPHGTHLFFTNGDRQLFDPAQDPKSTFGKVLRLNLDGSPASGNPLAAKGFHPAVWSYGHRNLLGITFDKDGRLWEMEMGPRHGDEINLIKPGLNYGWPKASNGDHYDGRAIPDHQSGDGYEPPKLFWVPAISPGGLAYYDGALFPAWRNSLFITGLSGQSLDRIALDGENASKADHWDMGARIRGVRAGPDGAIYIIEDGEGGRLLKLTPPA